MKRLTYASVNPCLTETSKRISSNLVTQSVTLACKQIAFTSSRFLVSLRNAHTHSFSKAFNKHKPYQICHITKKERNEFKKLCFILQCQQQILACTTDRKICQSGIQFHWVFNIENRSLDITKCSHLFDTHQRL